LIKSNDFDRDENKNVQKLNNLKPNGQHQYVGTLCDLRGGMCKNCFFFFFFKNAKQLICNDFFSSEFSSFDFFLYKEMNFFSNNFLTRRKKLLLECMIT
jgi:hypothetical protein